mmetsp:Transcript_72945/g.201314  ORF Transcript_72945/g.201314 Transcript_72945/m.201314 type:complete len:221 (+) Transcript_72945:1736-2398(+)
MRMAQMYAPCPSPALKGVPSSNWEMCSVESQQGTVYVSSLIRFLSGLLNHTEVRPHLGLPMAADPALCSSSKRVLKRSPLRSFPSGPDIEPRQSSAPPLTAMILSLLSMMRNPSHMILSMELKVLNIDRTTSEEPEAPSWAIPTLKSNAWKINKPITCCPPSPQRLCRRRMHTERKCTSNANCAGKPNSSERWTTSMGMRTSDTNFMSTSFSGELRVVQM